MYLKELHIVNYKNIGEASLSFCRGVNYLVGRNGQGKTNVLDAIYYLSFCKSHTNSIDSQNIRHTEEFFLLQGAYERQGQLEEYSAGMKRRQKKHFKHNKKEYERLSDHIGELPLVLISPADAELIADGSEERRRFMDGMISQYDRQYLVHLLQYNNALKQRNVLLKQEEMPQVDLLEIYELEMVRHAGYLYEKRSELLERFVPLFQKYYSLIAGDEEQVLLRYVSQLQERDLQDALVRTRERDHLIGHTTQGIHKDELDMLLGDYPMKRVGSQGQQKTYLVALKLAQYELLAETKGMKPLLLLDDLFDKLDAVRMARILELVKGEDFGQIFVTDTDVRIQTDNLRLKSYEENRIFRVADGCVERDGDSAATGS